MKNYKRKDPLVNCDLSFESGCFILVPYEWTSLFAGIYSGISLDWTVFGLIIVKEEDRSETE